MSKQPIAWHEMCLTRMTNTHARYEAEAKVVQDRADRLWRECLRLTQQIEEAKRRGKDGFDADRFLTEPKPKTGGEDNP